MIKVSDISQNDLNGLQFNVTGDDTSVELVIETPPALNWNGESVSSLVITIEDESITATAAFQGTDNSKIAITFSVPPPLSELTSVSIAAQYNSL
jgi:hypothetical protein